MKRYEYRIIDIGFMSVQSPVSIINQAAIQGWRLVGVVSPHPDYTSHYFEREMPPMDVPAPPSLPELGRPLSRG